MEKEIENRVKQTLVMLADEAGKNGLEEYVVIGGNAVIANGVPRFTNDIDFAVPERDARAWRDFLESLGFPLIHRTPAFAQYDDKATPRPRVDLMLLDELTWERLKAGSWGRKFGAGESLVASPEHIIAMKLKALQSPYRKEKDKDWSDIVELTLRHKFDPEKDPGFRSHVLHFGTEVYLTNLVDEIRKRHAADAEIGN